MESYNYQKQLKQIWEDGLAKYESGLREPNDFFSTEVLAELAAAGLNVMDVFDYVEDFANHGEPDFETFLMICEARRDYFLTEQNAKPSDKRLDNAALPGKTEQVEGLVWLPRIIPKALGKLRGELPPETMFCCGGDRKFLKEHDIHPAEFLRAAWAYEDHPDRLVEWVLTRKGAELTT
jgi:hypothetical protein